MNQTRPTTGGLALPALLLTLLLLLATRADSRPSTESDNESDIASLPPDVDNVELHHAKLVNGVLVEDHPVVMYKEDFVNEDYGESYLALSQTHCTDARPCSDPAKNQSKTTPHRQYKHLKRTRHHHSRPVVEKSQEKILFDVLPETPIFAGDGDDDDSGADTFVVAPLLEPSKSEALQKFPKKYHSRQRRQAVYSYKNSYYVPEQQVHYRTYAVVLCAPCSYPVDGKKPKYRGKLPIWQNKPNMPTNIGTRFDDEENSLFHDSNPANADFSKFDQPRPQSGASSSGGSSSANNFPPLPTRAPGGGFQSPPLTTRAPSFQTPLEEATTARPATSAPATGRRTTPRVSSCVWAIVNCCSQGNSEIHYHCFEEFGCHGAFWGINPCADNGKPPSTDCRPDGCPVNVHQLPCFITDALVYPEEPSYEVGSVCHRAAKLCCNLSNLASLYDCFLHQNCENSISEILSTCS
ncbi:hypothetical protein KR093_003432 [Drosophila rubida]|uniref:Uncharacterized protein n=1 Tax=Drosophila rubida TaxID=30044 RepID=A0AAD4PGR5_9MUSC|nr:hypothetical protein KR093_003432 [Drosophila rubida]